MATIYTVIPFLAFVAVGHPAAYQTTRKILGDWIANSYGLPTTAGVALHALVFVILVSFLMRLFTPSKSTYSDLGMAELSGIADFDAQMASFHPSAKDTDMIELGPAAVPAPAPAPARGKGTGLFSSILR